LTVRGYKGIWKDYLLWGVRKMENDYDLEFNMGSPGPSGVMTIAVNARNSYDKRLSYAEWLLKKLKTKIPFKYMVVREPEVLTFGGDCRKGMISVEMDIDPVHKSLGEAVSMLRKAGFTTYIWPTAT